MPSVFETKILSAFEQAEAEEDVDLTRFVDPSFWLARTNRRRDGGGGSLFFVRTSFVEFRGIDPIFSTNCFDRCRSKRSCTFAPSLSEAAEEHLQKLGVEFT